MKKTTETVKALNYMRTMPKSRWAWEFLRRNPAYQADFQRHENGALSRTRKGSLEILKLDQAESDAEKWGLLFFANPDNDAKTAPVFWTQKANPNVISVEMTERTDDDPKGLIDTIFDLRLFGAHRIHLTDANNQEHLLLQRGNRVVQMLCRGHTLLNGDVKLNFILEGFGSLDAKLDTIKRLAKLYDSATENRAITDGWSARTLSLRDALIALDIYQAGKQHVDAAIAILGDRAIENGHGSFEGALKNKMYRARKRGIEYMEGGYLDLMQ